MAELDLVTYWDDGPSNDVLDGVQFLPERRDNFEGNQVAQCNVCNAASFQISLRFLFLSELYAQWLNFKRSGKHRPPFPLSFPSTLLILCPLFYFLPFQSPKYS